MTVWNKEGVMGYLSPKAQKGFGRVVRLYEKHGKDLYRTSIMEGNHQGGSFHYIGCAWDQRQDGVPIVEVMEALGLDFDVVRNDTLGIYHCELDEVN